MDFAPGLDNARCPCTCERGLGRVLLACLDAQQSFDQRAQRVAFDTAAEIERDTAMANESLCRCDAAP